MPSPFTSSGFSGPVLSLIAFAIALNVVMGQIVTALKVPLYLDMIGTILCAALAGFRPAAVAAVSGNIIAAILGSPAMLFFAPVGIVVAGVSAAAFRLRAFTSPVTAAFAGLVQGAIAATISAPISAFVFGGVTVAGTDLVVALYRGSGFSLLHSTWLQGLTTDIPDKIICYLLVAGLLHDLPERVVRRFRPYHRPSIP